MHRKVARVDFTEGRKRADAVYRVPFHSKENDRMIRRLQMHDSGTVTIATDEIAAHSIITDGRYAVHDPGRLRLGSQERAELALQALGRGARIRLRIYQLFRLRRQGQGSQHHPECALHFFRISIRYSVDSGVLMPTRRSTIRCCIRLSFSDLAAKTNALAFRWPERVSII